VKQFYPVSQPSITETEVAYVCDAVRSGWVSSIGKYVDDFERRFAHFCGTEYALATCNGTTALHLALTSLGIKAGDEVIVPDLTFVATANAVTYTGAKALTVDIDERTLCIDPKSVERAITPRTRAVIPVHLYGHPAEMDAINGIAKSRGLLVIEDAAEAHGAEYRGRKVGALGDCGVFSFYGNKILTSGEGGMITTSNRELYRRAKHLRDHAMSAERKYWHTELGYNYRLTNLQAALGVAQLERIDALLNKRRTMVGWYRETLGANPRLRSNAETRGVTNAYWMFCLEVEGLTEETRSELMRRLKHAGVDSRPYFRPISDMPMYPRAVTPVAHRIASTGINLPSYFDIEQQDVQFICDAVRRNLDDMALWQGHSSAARVALGPQHSLGAASTGRAR
jgi:perosamine synthetase